MGSVAINDLFSKKWAYLYITAMLIFFSSTYLQAQSGWTLKKGEYFFKVYSNYGSSDEFYNLDGTKLSTNEFTQLTTGFYGEHGITDKITLLTHGPLIRHQYFENSDKITGIGDLPIGFKYQILDGKIPVSLGALVEVPLAKADNFVTAGQEQIGDVIVANRINIPTGDGEWNFRFTAAASHSFYPTPVYVTAYGTYNLRTEYEGVEFSDQFVAGFEGGVSIIDKIWLTFGLQVQKSLGESEVVDFVRGEGTEFTSLQLAAIYMFTEKLGINLSSFFYNDIVTDRINLYSANVYSIGVSYQLKK